MYFGIIRLGDREPNYAGAMRGVIEKIYVYYPIPTIQLGRPLSSSQTATRDRVGEEGIVASLGLSGGGKWW